MKQTLTLLIFAMSLNSFGQTLKTFSGPFNDGRLQNGNATYTYYEDPNSHEYLKQGAFKYTFKGQGEYLGFDQTITGSFDKGLKNGTWTYVITMTDFGKGNPYATGTVTLTSNYKNGYADGNWKEVRSYKNRKKYLVYGQYKWEPFEAPKTMTINMNFNDGYLVGAVSINDEFAKFKATGSYDNNSLCIGTWIINDMGWGKNRELIYKDNTLYEFIARGNNGEVLEGTTKYQNDYDNLVKAKAMTLKEREEAGFSLDTICGGENCAATNNIKEYFPKLFSVDYFLYEFIGGDLSFKEGFKGGCDIQVSKSNYTSLAENSNFKEAEELYSKNDLLKAYETYNKIDINSIKPSERKTVSDKIALIKPMIGDLIEVYHANSKFFKEYASGQYDSIQKEFSKQISEYKLVVLQLQPGQSFSASYEYEYDKMRDKPCWNEWNWANAQECFTKYRKFYETYQIAFIEGYLKYNEAISKEESNVKKSGYSFKFENTNNQFYTYDKATFLNNLKETKNNYELGKSIKELYTKAIEKKSQIETLNDQNKKKTLLKKYLIVYNDLIVKYNAYTSLTETIKVLNTLSTLSDKVIAYYSQDTKELESKLKDVETSEQIQTILLGQ